MVSRCQHLGTFSSFLLQLPKPHTSRLGGRLCRRPCSHPTCLWPLLEPLCLFLHWEHTLHSPPRISSHFLLSFCPASSAAASSSCCHPCVPSLPLSSSSVKQEWQPQPLGVAGKMPSSFHKPPLPIWRCGACVRPGRVSMPGIRFLFSRSLATDGSQVRMPDALL